MIKHVLLLRCEPRLREVMLEVLDAPQSHHALPLRRTPAERLLRFVRRVHVRVESGLSARFLNSSVRRCGYPWELERVIELALGARRAWWKRALLVHFARKFAFESAASKPMCSLTEDRTIWDAREILSRANQIIEQ